MRPPSASCLIQLNRHARSLVLLNLSSWWLWRPPRWVMISFCRFSLWVTIKKSGWDNAFKKILWNRRSRSSGTWNHFENNMNEFRGMGNWICNWRHLDKEKKWHQKPAPRNEKRLVLFLLSHFVHTGLIYYQNIRWKRPIQIRYATPSIPFTFRVKIDLK